jgi:hypothetical protein
MYSQLRDNTPEKGQNRPLKRTSISPLANSTACLPTLSWKHHIANDTTTTPRKSTERRKQPANKYHRMRPADKQDQNQPELTHVESQKGFEYLKRSKQFGDELD